ncbi:Protein TAR1 [Capsicum baccatum]|uniref:Protein TAR1 n=1 Tax=Capsicum baccatum TaxID=33114 RepID=A0A2G2UZ45_CAPBA|nr:Protein TAR1 [Capsicum baccatum]
MASGATCVQRLNGSRDSAIHTEYHISQRSSSMREPRYPLSRLIFVYRRSTGPPDARRGWGARGRLSINVFLGAFCTGVRWSPAAHSGACPLGTGGGARAECRSTPPARTPQLLNTFPGAFGYAGFHNDPFAGSPTETLLPLLLPLNDKVQWTSHDVAGFEPPTSPRSKHFTGSFNRQIAPPTKNGHAPPPIESRKSSQSVNPYYVWTCAGGRTRPVKARSASLTEGTRQSVHTIGAGITAAVGTRLGLQWILVKGFRLYSFQLPDSLSPDQPGSIPHRRRRRMSPACPRGRGRIQDERFARQYRCGPPPEFSLASPRLGIVHHLSGHDRSNGEPTGKRPERTDAEARRRRALPATIDAGPRPGSIGVPACRHSTSDRGASPAPIRFPPDNFKHSLTLFSKSFSSFPRGTCSLSVSRPYLALDGIHRPIWAAFPNNPTRRQRLVVRQGPGTTRLSPSPAPPSRGLGPGPPLRTLLQTIIRTTEPPDSKAGLFPIRSALLRDPCKPRARGAREASIRRATTARPVIEARCEGATRCVMPRQTCPRPNGFGCNLHSKTRWFTGFCISHQVSHFTTFFIDAKAEISVAESRFRLQKKHRGRRSRNKVSVGELAKGSLWKPAQQNNPGNVFNNWGVRAGGVLRHSARAPSPVTGGRPTNPDAESAKKYIACPSRPIRGMRRGGLCFFCKEKRLSATDISALASMKNVAKCDTWCELQNPMNGQVFERKLRPKPLGRGHVCLGIMHRVAPSHRASITERVVIAGRILASGAPRARGWPKCESTSTDVTASGGCNSTLFAVAAMARRASELQDPFALRRSDRDPRSGGITR